MRTVWESSSRAISRALAQHHGVCEGSSTRRNVDGSSAGEIEATHEERPAFGVPCPARDGVVDYSRPDENENQTRQHTPTVGSSADGKSWTMRFVSFLSHVFANDQGNSRNSSKHALVHCKQDLWDLWAARRWRCKHIAEPDMAEVADVIAPRAECERVAPEEPLEAYDANRHHREPDEGKRGLAARETRVEEADTGNHK